MSSFIIVILLLFSCVERNTITKNEIPETNENKNAVIVSSQLQSSEQENQQAIVIGGYTTNRSLKDIDITGIIYITISDEMSSNLSGVEQLANANLKQIDLRLQKDVRNIDFSPLQHLQHLEKIEITGRGITIIPDLSGLSSLRFLRISSGKITSLDGIEKVPDLETLVIGDNDAYLSDISSLRHVTNLKNLEFANGNFVIDFSALQDLPNLEYLLIYHYDVLDLQGISGLKNLKKLVLSPINKGIGGEIAFAHLDDIGNLTWLRELNIDYLPLNLCQTLPIWKN